MKTEYDGMKLLSTVLREQGVTRRNDILEFIRNSELIRLNTRKKINTEHVRFGYSDSNSNLRFGYENIYPSEILVVGFRGKTREDFIKKLQKLDNRIAAIEEEKAEVKNKMQYMQQSGSDHFDEKEYKTYKVIQTIKEGGMNDFEKAKLISELIK